jgi:hypothetical protein
MQRGGSAATSSEPSGIHIRPQRIKNFFHDIVEFG